VRLDLQTLTPIWLPTQTLERLIFEKISIRGRALVAAVEVISCIDALEKSIGYRNELIAEFQRQPGLSERQRMEWYFGLRSQVGTIDERFASNIGALYAQIDDCIFFHAFSQTTYLSTGRVFASDLHGGIDWVCQSQFQMIGRSPRGTAYCPLEKNTPAGYKAFAHLRPAGNVSESGCGHIATDMRARGGTRGGGMFGD
jgi:hypothetical protein